MMDLAADLRQHFDWEMYQCQEAYVVSSDGRSFERSDRDERAIELFRNLHDTLDAMPVSLVTAASALRDGAPERFEARLRLLTRRVGAGFVPASAAEFIEELCRAA